MVGGIDFHRGGLARRCEGCLQVVLHLGIGGVVILRLADQVGGVGLGDQQMRAVRLVGDKTVAAMEAAHRGNAGGHGGGGAERQCAAHAIALHADFLGLVCHALRVQERDIGRGVLVHALIGHGGAIAHQLGAGFRIGEIEIVAHHRRMRGTVEGVHHQHDIALAGQAAPHVAESGAKTHDVGPDQHGGPLALGVGMKQNRITGAVRGFHRDIHFHHIALRHGRAGAAGDSGCHQPEGAPRKAGIRNQAGMDELVAHGLSLRHFLRAEAKARTVSVSRQTIRPLAQARGVRCSQWSTGPLRSRVARTAPHPTAAPAAVTGWSIAARRTWPVRVSISPPFSERPRMRFWSTGPGNFTRPGGRREKPTFA